MRVIDLFSGPGGLGTGFSKYFAVQTAVDWNPDAVKTYQTNHRETTVKEKDVRDVTFSQKDYEGVVGAVGGPPCQSFSQLNTRQNPNDFRSDLLFEMVRVAEEMKPEFLLIENLVRVPHDRKTKIVRALTNMGYKVVSRVVNACDYGAVQIRRRWILTATKKCPVYPQPRNGSIRKAKEILTNEVSEIKARKTTLEKIQSLPTGKWVALPGQKFKVYYVIDPNKPLPAIVNPTKLRYVKPDKSGYLSINELKRAQGFPLGYCFHGSLSSVGQQLANCVPVELGMAFAREFKLRLAPARRKIN